MSFFRNKPLAKSIAFDDENISVELLDGRKLIVPLVYFPRLFRATKKERLDYIISGGGTGIHWESLDEDIRVDNLLLGIFDSDGHFYKSA